MTSAHAYFGESAFDHDQLIADAARTLSSVKFDTLIGQGVSAAVVLPTLAHFFHVKFAVIRKPGENTHHSGRFIGDIGRQWLFVDDFISSGQTLAQVYDVVQQVAPTRTFAGAYLYNDRQMEVPKFRDALSIKQLLGPYTPQFIR